MLRVGLYFYIYMILLNNYAFLDKKMTANASHLLSFFVTNMDSLLEDQHPTYLDMTSL